MADRSKLKIADQDNNDQDDPFAELTKIMGFDPRVPVKRSEAEALQKLSAPAPVVDDFDIDLERELLGEFALDDEPAAPVAQSAAPRPVETIAPVQARAERQEQSSAPVEAAEKDEAEDTALDVDDFDMSDFDLAVADHASVEMIEPDRRAEEPAVDVRHEQVAQAAQPAIAADLDGAADGGLEEVAVEQQDVGPDDLDAAFAKSMDEFDGDWEPDTGAEQTAETEEPTRVAADTRSDMDMAFDAAMADVDMDFSAAPRSTVVESFEEHLKAAEADEDDLADLMEAEPREPAARAGDASNGDRTDFDEKSLEDEFNALLGNSAKAQPIAEAPVQQAADTLSDDLDDLDWELEALSEDEQPVAERPLYAAEADEADLEQLVAAAEEDEPEAEYLADSDDDWAGGLESVSKPVQVAAPVADEDDLAFDDAAFAATFADGMDDLLPEEDASRFDDEELEPVAAAPAPVEPMKEPDPFEALRRMAGSWRSAPQASPTPVQARVAEPFVAYEPEDEPVSGYEPEGEPEEAFAQAHGGYDDAPEIETVDVPENAIALADDLDLPELAFEEDEPAQAYDDLDAEFATLLNEMNSPEPAPVAQHASRDAWLDRGRERAMPASTHAYPAAATAGASAAYASAAPARPAQPVEEIDLGDLELNFDDQAFDQAFAVADDGDALPDIPDYDPDFDEDLSVPGMPPVAEAPSRRGFWIAALVGGVAIAGGVGAFALSLGDGAGTDSPALVKADSSPIKVRPENPGGSVVPNQDNKVYESVANAKGPAAAPAQPPKQEKLVTTTEEPVDVAAAETDAPEAPVGFSTEEEGAIPPMAKGEDRIEQVIGAAEGAAAAEEVPTVQPRKVRTMIVKPDGSLVPADMPTPEPSTGAGMGADAQPLEPAKPTGEVVASTPEATGTVPPAEAAPVAEVPAKPKGKTQSSNTPNQVAIAPARPADQPLDIVGEVKPDQVAAIDTQPTATAVASGAWSMQIASQPSQEAAQSTYQDLARRYGGVLSGRSVNIVKAEIAGKGTFWRVRVPAQSRNDAVNLCNNYKAAGGNCFVSK